MVRSISSSSEGLVHQAELETSSTSSTWAKVALSLDLALPLEEVEFDEELDEEDEFDLDWDDLSSVELAESRFFCLGDGHDGDQWPMPPQLWHLELEELEEELWDDPDD